MNTRLSRFGPVLLIILMLALPLTAIGAEEGANQKAMSLLEMGVRQYQKGQYGQATETFNELLALRPDSQTALQLRRESELGLFAKMTGSENKQLASAADRLLQMMTQAARQQKREVANPDKIRTGLQSPDLDTYLEARARAVAHGPYSVPHLLPLMTEQGPKAQKVVGRVMSTLADIGKQATLPLIATLESNDNVLRIRVAGVLGQIGDERALPALMAIKASEKASQTLKDTANNAVEAITGKKIITVGSAPAQYVDLIKAYLLEDADTLGYVFGRWAEVWDWNADAQALPDRLTYEMVPSILYYQRQGTEYALQALELSPGDRRLQSLLPATLSRELEIARSYSHHGSDEEMVGYSTKRLEQLKKQIPVVCHLYDADVVGDALRHVMDAQDAAASFYLVSQLGNKVGVVPGDAAQALDAAAHYPGKDVRYQAAIELIKASPRGFVPNPRHVMQVLSAALKQAATRSALIVGNDLQFRNRIRTVLEEQGLQAVESNSDAGSISEALALQPNVDVVFIFGNAPSKIFDSAYQKVMRDGRTEGRPVFVVRNPRKSAPDLSRYEDINRVLSTDDVRAEPMKKILDSAARQQEILASPERAESVLEAALALQHVDPSATRYPLSVCEPSLIKALGAYGEDVTLAAIEDLQMFGSVRALPPLREAMAKTDASPALQSAACRAIAALLERNPGSASEGLLTALRQKVMSPEQNVKEAASEALGRAGVEPDEMLSTAKQALSPSAAGGSTDGE
mgnify:CR=1 FL=1